MRVGEAPGVDLVRYLIWITFSLITLGIKNYSANAKGLNDVMVIIFFIVGAITLGLMTRTYLRERNSFAEPRKKFFDTLVHNIGFITLMFVLIVVLRMMISYLQVNGKLPKFTNDDVVGSDQRVFIFNLLANVFIISVQQQLVQTGFFFNYFFRRSSPASAVGGIIISGLIAGAITLPGSMLQFFMNSFFGFCFALTYLYTQDEKMPIFLGMLSALIGTIMI
ncbi:CPBP family glutamic-type intramembrane protease [Companilactobacillus sp.]|uniref:CPBP family glutamic-type intramembrane protease n=1 Tax=Companilactobacillus sp. TaxID=2767905 RepID=UPI0025BB0ABC|nr:CPBP family glutamic-type intramembrane protease [Companilactobacillus sp.]MCH4010086.1 CAAX protease family protein [Companilactobacillus sp.]MCH4052238.1 CAAX protease family protein [Companilactobacillus sp.]MCH4078028.1 CAAX protease family protein [Companilactobacillus sp.]MCH4126604.1 CAAX protease family protein [Companilactobacillus sp.]MCH4132189.1 CAAX protease family protein [Companilactobacillus sp.]